MHPVPFSSLGNGNGTFASDGSYAVGSSNHVNDIIAADFNGDGILDLAVTCAPSSGAGYVEVLLGNGNGTFQGANSFATGNGPIGLAAADVNADGKPDLVVADSTSGKVSVLLGNGDGSFGMANNFTSGGVPNQVVVQDFNNDGKPDIAVDDATTNIIGVLLGNGDGTFQSRINSSVGSYPYPLSGMAVIGQSNTDLVVGDQISESVIILTSNGNGTFATAQTFSFPAVPDAIAVGDFSGNGAMDLAVTDHGSSEVSVLMQQLTTTSVTMTYSFDALNRQAASTDANGNTTTTVYDADSDVVAIQDPLNRINTTVYDAKNQTIVTIDPTGARAATQYDLRGLPIQVTDANGNNTTYSYDSDGRMLASTQGAGTGSALTTSKTYSAAGDVLTAVDGAGNTTSFLYDADGRITQATYPAAGVLNATSTATMLYDKLGNVTDQTDQNGSRTTFTYNSLNLLSSTTAGVGSGSTQTTNKYYDLDGRTTGVSTGGQLTETFYDAKSQVTLIIDPTGKLTTNTYDLRGLLTAVADPTQYSYDDAGHLLTTVTGTGSALVTMTNFYDSAGQLTGTEDGLNDLTTNYYDADGRITETVTPTGGSNSTTYYQFDKAGNLSQETDPDGNITTFTYDSLNQLSSETTIMGTQGYTALTTFAYNSMGLLASETDPLGRREDFLYDKLGRVTSQKWYDASANLTQTFTSTYNAAGDLITATSDAGTYTMTYNALNQVTQVAEPFTASLSFTYDSSGNRSLMQEYINGTLKGTTTTLYDGANRLTESLFTTSSGAETETDLDYYETNGLVENISHWSYPSSTRTFAGSTGFVYDTANRLEELDYYKGTNAVLATIGYTFDGANRLSSELDNGTTVATYSYNGTAELTKDGATTYTYDAAGNRTVAGTYTYSAAAAGNELTYDGVWTYTYDKAGNITQKVDAAGDTWTYGYNNANQMTTAKEVNGGTTLVQATYTYDFFGNMIEEVSTVSGTTTTQEHAIDQWNPANPAPEVWADLNGSNAITTQYQHGDQTDQIFASVTSAGTLTYLLADHLGSTRYITDSTGNTVNDTIVYNAWGTITSGTPSGEYLWAGYMQDSATGLYYDHARFYDPGTGRWTTQDPIGFAGGSVNLSEYVGNDPTNATDPSGKYLFFPNQAAANYWQSAFAAAFPAMNAQAEPVGNTGYYVLNPSTSAVQMIQSLSYYSVAPEMQRLAAAILSPTNNLLGNDNTSWIDLQPFQGIPQALIAGAQGIVPQAISSQAPFTLSFADRVSAFAEGYVTSARANLNGAASATWQTFSAGLGGDFNVVEVTDQDRRNGYDTSFVLQRFGYKLIWVAILKNAGTGGGFARDAVAAYNILQNGVGLDLALQDIDQNGLTLDNGFRAVANFLGILGEASGNAQVSENCFPTDTLVSTESGLRPICEIEAGERVWSYDFEAGDWHLVEVERRHDSNYNGPIVTLVVGGFEVRATAYHPFWVVQGQDLENRPPLRHVEIGEDRGESLPGRWVNSHDLREGDVIFLRNRGAVAVQRVIQRSERTAVCNLTIRGLHTFAVGPMQALVHNTSGTEDGGNTANFGTQVHQNNLEPYLNANYPGTDFQLNVGDGQHGPDAFVLSGDGSINPGFDAVELKPNSPSGIDQFLNTQLPNWRQQGYGNMLLLLYDLKTGKIFDPGLGIF